MTPAEVLATAASWVWVPDDTRVVRTDEFHLVAYPCHFADPTAVFRLRSQRPADALVDDVLAAARDLGRDAVTFAGLSDATLPGDLEQHLRERGAELVETLAVLGLDLRYGVPSLGPPSDVELRRVLDLRTRLDLDRVETTVFGGTPQSEEALAATVEAIASEADVPRWVAYRAGAPVGAGGLTVTGEVVRLWGACVLPEAQHTGVYRALLDLRLRTAAERGVEMALVKGRVETSAPVLVRAGFRRYGEERSYRLVAT